MQVEPVRSTTSIKSLCRTSLRVSQRLIVDRKFLAAFYTEPSSAALLIGLAIGPSATPSGGDWADAAGLANLKMADFACGTGTLVSTAYQRVSQLHEAAGGDAEALHPAMIADALIGCDVLPASAHLTASMLASAHPTVTFERSSIIALEYGKQSSGRFALGSLDLISAQQALDAVGLSGKLEVVSGGIALGGSGSAISEVKLAFQHEAFDLICMNPPFTRDTGHEGTKVGVSNPMFAAFDSSEADMKAMAAETAKLYRGTTYHGNAGEGSAFVALAHAKLKIGGTLALVLPLSLMTGSAWEKARQLLRRNYGDITVVSIAAGLDKELSFSADTGMAECLVVARKTGEASERATFVVLDHRPVSQIAGMTVAAQVRGVKEAGLRRLEDGPVGGTSLLFGDEAVGYALDAPLPNDGSWSISRIADPALAQTAFELATNSRAWLPGMSMEKAPELKIVPLGTIAQIGPYHMDINGKTAGGGIRGPFDVVERKPHSVPTNPILWGHKANRERAIEFEEDCEGVVKKAKSATEKVAVSQKVQKLRDGASHCHLNRDFRFNSQSTGMQYTPRKVIGGRAWPSIRLESEMLEKALTLWGNTSLGILAYWSHANKQQAGRGSIGVAPMRSLPVLDVTTFDDDALKRAAVIFEDLRTKPLKPVNEIDEDSVRAELDSRFFTEVLGWPATLVSSGGPVDLLRKKLAVEPSIYGGKDDSDLEDAEEEGAEVSES